MPLPGLMKRKPKAKLMSRARDTHMGLEPSQQLTMHLPTEAMGSTERPRLWHQKKEICRDLSAFAFFLCTPLIQSKGALKTSRNFDVSLVYLKCLSSVNTRILSMA